jgi:hypothetical protein
MALPDEGLARNTRQRRSRRDRCSVMLLQSEKKTGKTTAQ